MSQFLRRGPGADSDADIDDPGAHDRQNITGPMMAQYLMALLGAQRPGGARGGAGGDPFAELFGGLGPLGGLGAFGGGEGQAGNGRWGDYVFNQEGTYHLAVSSIRDLTFGISSGPDHHSNHGELKFWEASTRYRRDHGEAT